MRGDSKLINIRYNDGVVKRLPREKAEVQVELGRAKYISQTLFKAAVEGVTVKQGQTDTEIKAAIRASKVPLIPVKPEKTETPEKRQGHNRRRRRQKVETE